MGGDLYMNYKRIYDQLIEKRRLNPISSDQYGERHHIIPKSEGGSDDDGNLVRLTAREHYIAHLLLARIYDDYKMYSALTYMRCGSTTNQRNYKFNSRLYGLLRNHVAEKRSAYMKEHRVMCGEKNPMFGKHHSDKSKQKMRTRLHGQRNGTNNSFYGRHHTEETKNKLRIANVGKTLSDEHKKKISQALSDPILKEHMRRAISEAQKGAFWVTNGIENKFLNPHDEIPAGFHRGRTIQSKSTSGYHWWNNGVINKMSKDCPEEGWKTGRTMG